MNVFAGIAQSKKEQIELLNSRNDSLQATILIDRKASIQKIHDLDAVILNLESRINFFKSELDRVNDKFTKKDVEYNNLSKELSHLRDEFKSLEIQLASKKDSINILRSNNSVYTDEGPNGLECWKGVSIYDTLITVNKNQLFIVPIDCSEFNDLYSDEHWYDKNDKGVQSTSSYIKLTFRNGKTKLYKNKYGFNGYDEKYTFLASLEKIDYYLIEVNYYEGGEYLLIDKDNGTEISVFSEPYFSENNKYVAFNEANCESRGGLEIFEIGRNKKVQLFVSRATAKIWQPKRIVWTVNNDLLIQKYICPCMQTKYSKLILK